MSNGSSLLAYGRTVRCSFLLAMIAVFLTAGFPGPAHGQDKVGIYWDTGYSNTFTEASSIPDILSGYLVLKDPSTPFGVAGWECCAEVDGPGQFLSWTLEGQAVNLSGTPCFRVGISGPPLPSQGDVLLATFQIMVTDSLPTTLSLRADFKPTLPLQMSYIPADDPGNALPMTTSSGTSEVALINGAPDWSYSPSMVDFGWVYLGNTVTATFRIHNRGPIGLSLDVGLDNPLAGITITGGGGTVGLVPGRTHIVDLDFSPNDVGHFTANLILGPEGSLVPLSGNGETDVGVCSIHPDTLIFGPVIVGESQTRSFTVTNHGQSDLYIQPTSDSPAFIPRPPRYVLPIQTREFEVTFEPQSPGAVVGNVDLGNSLCSDIFVAGNATALPIGNGPDLVGIFFDSHYSDAFIETTQPDQVVPGYLVMLNPSETTGVGAWELALGIDGDAQWLGWTLEGQAVNAGRITASGKNELVIGIGGSPLPYSSKILLATFQFLVVAPYPSIVNLELEPIQFPSLPNQMVWAPWHDSNLLLPLEQSTGTTIVAGINWNTVSNVGLPGSGAETRLLGNVPNPFNPSTEIRFELAKAQPARVAIYDVSGRLVKILEDGHLESGPHMRVWKGRDFHGRQVPSGVYYVRLKTQNWTDHSKIMLLK